MLFLGLVFMRLSRFHDPSHRFDMLTRVNMGYFFFVFFN